MPLLAPHILVIRLSAFGDICLSFGTFEKIRAAHPQARITLLTTPLFAKLLDQCPFFDNIETVTRWRVRDIGDWVGFARRMARADYDLVYDLQDNDRTSLFRRLSPRRTRRNWLRGRVPLSRQKPQAQVHIQAQAALGNVIDISACAGCLPQDLGWLDADVSSFDLPDNFVLLVPGSAPQHPGKRWPAAHYAALAQSLVDKGITPVLIGTENEKDATGTIAQACPTARDLTGQTSFPQIAALARLARGAVGNDTGPMHLISICGCPIVSLFSHVSDPAASAPRGTQVTVLREKDMARITPESVLGALEAILR